MIFLVTVRFITLDITYNKLIDRTRTFIVKATDKIDAKEKIDRVIGTYPHSDKHIIQLLRIKQALLDKNDVGEII